MELKNFNPTDWDAFAGATSFADGHPPMSAEGWCFVVVVDQTGIGVWVTDGKRLDTEEGDADWYYSLNWPTRTDDQASFLSPAARRVLSTLIVENLAKINDQPIGVRSSDDLIARLEALGFTR